MLMPFGKYKGHELTALPDEYLLWLIATVPLRDPLLSAVAEEITRRDLELPPLPSPSPRAPKRQHPEDEGGAWTMGGDPQEIIAGDFPMSSRHRSEYWPHYTISLCAIVLATDAMIRSVLRPHVCVESMPRRKR